MKASSAKAKGRRLQQEVRDKLLQASPKLKKDDIRSTSMGAGGEDLLLSPAAREVYPFSIECKNTEKLNIWKAIDQARENSENHVETVVFKRNHEKAFIAMPLDDFLEIFYEYVKEVPTSRNATGFGDTDRE